MNSFLADVLVGVHLCVVLFMTLGFLAIALGALRRWKWIRNPWFRLPHFGILVYLVVSGARDEPCFLTLWEARLRRAAGQTEMEEISFVGRVLREGVFIDLDPLWLHRLYLAAGVFGLLMLVVLPPRRPAPKSTS